MKHLSRTQDDMEWVGMVWYDGLVRDGMGWDGILPYEGKVGWERGTPGATSCFLFRTPRVQTSKRPETRVRVNKRNARSKWQGSVFRGYAYIFIRHCVCANE